MLPEERRNMLPEEKRNIYRDGTNLVHTGCQSILTA